MARAHITTHALNAFIHWQRSASEKSSATARQETIPLANTIRLLMALSGRYPAWPSKYDLPMQGLLILLLLTSEWLLRRRWQLP